MIRERECRMVRLPFVCTELQLVNHNNVCRTSFHCMMSPTCLQPCTLHFQWSGRSICRPPRRRHPGTTCRHTATVQTDVLISTYTDSAGELMRAATFSRLASQPDPSDQPVDIGTSTSSGRAAGQAEVIQFPKRSESEAGARKDPPLVRIRLSVNYRVHSRQMLCIGGSQIPFGWSFLSIAKVPMVWNQGDIWTAEVGHAPCAMGICYGPDYAQLQLSSCRLNCLQTPKLSTSMSSLKNR